MRRKPNLSFSRFWLTDRHQAIVACFLACVFSLSVCVSSLEARKPPRTRISFAEAKEPLKPKPQEWQINGIVAALDDSYSEVKRAAFGKISEFDAKDLKVFPKQSEEVAKRAIKNISNSKEEVNLRTAAVEALGNLDKNNLTAVQTLVIVVNDSKENSEIRITAAEALGNLDKNNLTAVQALITLLNNSKETSEIRIRAVAVLSNLDKNNSVAVRTFTTIINNSKEDINLRFKTVEALGDLNKNNLTAVQALITLLNNTKENGFLRISAARAIIKLDRDNPAIVQTLTAIVKSEEESKLRYKINSRFRAAEDDVSSTAVEALGTLGETNPIAMQTLTAIVNNSKADYDLRSKAVDALGNLRKTSPMAVQTLISLLNNSKEEVNFRSSAVGALGKLGKTNPTAVQTLIRLLNNNSREDSFLRSGAVDALGDLEETNPTVVQTLTAIVSNSKADSELRSDAVNALGKLGKTSPMAVQALTAIVNNSKTDSELRSSAAEALGNLGETSPTVVQALITLLNDSKEGSSFSSRTVDALGNIGNTSRVLGGDPDQGLPVDTLGNIGNTSPTAVQALITLLNDSKATPELRSKTAEVLGNIGNTSPTAVQALITLLNDSKATPELRSKTAEVLGALKQLSLGELFVLIDRTFDVDSSGVHQMRFSSYFYGRGSSEIKTLMKWVGRVESLPKPNELSNDELRKALEVFKKAWEPSREFPRLRRELAGAIATVSSRGKWNIGDALLLEQHYKNLKDANLSEADTVKTAIDSLTLWKYLNQARNVIVAHLLFWAVLIFAYPKYSWIQAVFFWNPWVRKIGGVGYVGFLLAWVPFLRRKLFEPFKVSLLADARLTNFDPTAYFPESNVILVGSRHVTPLNTTLTDIQGQTILEGSSGLGKSMFLRHLVQQSSRIVVFLPARKCENGVIEAIQAKLHGQAQDAEFLKNLIYSGAIDICIDGLNEVTADTRAKISQFVESYFKGNIILTTQPIEWIAPSTAKIYELQPLQTDQIETFLLSRSSIVAPSSEATYADSCRSYLAQALNPNQSSEELAATQRILSNPMDLTVVAQMIALGKTPDLFRLQEQQYQLMAADYHDRWNQDFPMKKFAEALYQLRLNDEKAIPPNEFLQELTSMEDEQYKMVVSRQWKDAKGEPQHEWYCRHDKIMEFFIVQTFLGDGETAQNRLIDHMGDSRFRGVYFLLATLLPLDEATDLRERLILYAANTKDHTVSDTFVQLFHSRATLNTEVASLI